MDVYKLLNIMIYRTAIKVTKPELATLQPPVTFPEILRSVFTCF